MASRSRTRTTPRFPRPAASPAEDARRRFRFRPSLVVLERRTLLSNLVVTNTGDNGSGSLRDEIGLATSGDTITFEPSLFSGGAQTITLTSGVLDITSDVTIDGPGATMLSISGNNTQQVIDVTGGSALQPVTLTGLTVTDGAARFAGGIINYGTLTLSGCTVSGNSNGSVKARYGSAGGAGIRNVGTLTMTGCTVSDNSADNTGGGIYSTGTLTMTDCTVSGNTVARHHGYNGLVVGGAAGGIFCFGTTTMTDCAVSGNTASYAGGNIVSDGTLTMTECTISEGSAQYSGGGLFNVGTANLLGCTIDGNTANETISGNPFSGSGGGIYNEGPLTLVGCTVTSNVAAVDGGGIADITPSSPTGNPRTTTMSDCTVAGNTALNFGGGIYNGAEFPLEMNNCTISGNRSIVPLVNGQVQGTGGGGGIFSGGKLEMTNCTVYGNAANNGSIPGVGGGLEIIGPFAILSNCTVTSNIASTGGGAGGGDIDAPFGTLILNNCIIANSQLLGGDIEGFVSGGYNFVDDPKYAGGLVDGIDGNIVKSENPGLSVLGFHGGLTETVVPLSEPFALPPVVSPAIGAGNPALVPTGITTDQRAPAHCRRGRGHGRRGEWADHDHRQHSRRRGLWTDH